MNISKRASKRVKYPRTFHLPYSPGATSDDKILSDTSHFNGKEVIVTEKMDGENCTIGQDYSHARSMDSLHHESQSWVKGLQSRIGHEIPDGWRLCGENLYAQHSITYEELPSYFMLFSVWNENNFCLSWDDTVEVANMLEIDTVPVLYRGIWDEEKIKEVFAKYSSDKVAEGYVVRTVSGFSYNDFDKNVAKFVRGGHVQTEKHWKEQKIIPNKLRPKEAEFFILKGTSDVRGILKKTGNDQKYLYHYAPKNVNILKEGIKTPASLKGTKFEKEIIDVYEDRAKKELGKNKVDIDDIIKYLEKHRGNGGSRVISVLLEPIPKEANKDVKHFVKNSDCYKIDYNKALKDGVVEKSAIVEESPKSIRWVDDLMDELSKNKIKDWKVGGKLLFSKKPHGFIVVKDGILPSKYVELQTNLNELKPNKAKPSISKRASEQGVKEGAKRELKDVLSKLRDIDYGMINKDNKKLFQKDLDALEEKEENWWNDGKSIKLLTTDEMVKNRIGSCYEQSLLIYKLLKEAELEVRMIFVKPKNGEGNSHCAILCKDDNSGWFWIENAWGSEAGIHGPYKKFEDGVKEIIDEMKKNWKNVKEYYLNNNVDVKTILDKKNLTYYDFEKHCLKNVKSISKRASEYEKKRDFSKTKEPKGGKKPKENKHRFVIQDHEADLARRHFDLRLENDQGSMSSWAIPKHKLPKGSEKLLAAKTENHPIEYNKFEGEIEEGYGAGTVKIHDSGTYKEIEWGKDKIKFKLNGKKYKSKYVLFKTKKDNWMIKEYKEKSACLLSKRMIKNAARVWGKEASGILLMCGNKVLLQKRSGGVHHGGTWSIPGGAVVGERFFDSKTLVHTPVGKKKSYESAIKETIEEGISRVSLKDKKPKIVFRFMFDRFLYTTFVIEISEEEKNVISLTDSWESSNWQWFDKNNLPRNIHPGFAAFVNSKAGAWLGLRKAE